MLVYNNNNNNINNLQDKVHYPLGFFSKWDKKISLINQQLIIQSTTHLENMN